MEDLLPFLLAALVVGAAKGGLVSAGTLAVPALSLITDPLAAAATLLPVFIVSDVAGVWLYRRAFSLRNVLTLAGAGLVGVALTAVLLPYVPVAWLTLLTGMIGLLHLLQVNLRRLFAGLAATRKFQLLPGLFWGLLIGITSFVSHSGTPPFQRFMLPQRLPKPVYAGTSTLVFAAINLGKWPAYLAAGLTHGHPWLQVALLCTTGVLGTLIGRWLALRLSDRVYLTAIEVLLLAISLQLVWQSLGMLL